jgi:GNAT superfamily N-acetyltransferase
MFFIGFVLDTAKVLAYGTTGKIFGREIRSGMLNPGEIIEYVKTLGLLDLVKANIQKYIFLRARRIVLSWSVEGPIPEPKGHRKFLEAVTIRKGTLADAAELHQMMKKHRLWRSVGELRQWIERGCFLFVALYKGEIIGYVCVADEIPSRHSIFRKAIRLKPDDAYGVHAFVAAEYRGKRVYSTLALEMGRHLRAAGCKRLVLTVDPQNLAVRTANRRRGMKEVAEIEILKVLFFTRAEVLWAREEARDILDQVGKAAVRK